MLGGGGGGRLPPRVDASGEKGQNESQLIFTYVSAEIPAVVSTDYSLLNTPHLIFEQDVQVSASPSTRK